MKRLLYTLLLAAAILLPQVARAGETYGIEDVPNTYARNRQWHVSDPDGILDAASTEEINRTLTALEDSTGIQSMVVMLKSIGREDIFEFSHSLFRHWGIGSNERNEGLLILYVEDQRAIRFTTGYGLEGVLPDAICRRIQDRYMLPHFRQGHTGQGMVEGIHAVAQVLDGSMENMGGGDEDEAEVWLVVMMLAGMIGIAIMTVWLSHRHATTCPRCRKAGALQEVSSTSYRDALRHRHIRQTLQCTRCGHTVVRDRRVNDDNFGSMSGGALLGGGRGLGGGGGFSGGFFGGGSTGGGGATGRW